MDQKHSMLYPSLSGRGESSSSTSHDDGIPTEAPPSYDMAMATSPSTPAPQPSAPAPTTPTTIGFTDNSRQYPVPGASPPMVNASLEGYSSNGTPQRPVLPPVIVEQPGSQPLKLGPQPSTVTCPECGDRRKTRMNYTPNTKTHIYAFVLCLVGWCCCACCVPYCMNSCKTGHHYCANCNRFLGTFTRNG